MGVLHRTIRVPDLHRYGKEFNDDGTEEHITCDGARYHVLHWDKLGTHCSEPNCEVINDEDW